MVYTQEQQQEEISRTRLPRDKEVIGLVVEMLGGGKARIDCDDSFQRICRITGKIRKKQWIKPGDLVLIKPWVVQENERGDIVWKYTRTQAYWLSKSGKIKILKYE